MPWLAATCNNLHNIVHAGFYANELYNSCAVVIVLLLGEEAEASPSIANTLWRVWTMFTRSAITPPDVNGFGWNLGNSESIVGAVSGKFWARSAQKRQREREPKFCFFCPLNNARFHRLPIGQISRNLHKRRVSVWSVGVWKTFVKICP